MLDGTAGIKFMFVAVMHIKSKCDGGNDGARHSCMTHSAVLAYLSQSAQLQQKYPLPDCKP